MRISLADYGVGNIHSIRKALEIAGFEVETVTDMSKLLDARAIMFPGVGAFDATMERLLPYREGIRRRMQKGVPTLGICIGAQILFPSSDEGNGPGIGFFGGRVRGLKSKTVPHMGWNIVKTQDPLFDGIEDRHFYFAHSFYCDPEDKAVVKGTTEYEGFEFATVMRDSNTVATQFHPEKSSDAGAAFLKNFEAFAEETQ
ncbi:MAG: imidazole glycerol phosphate synthase subunit HisH [Methanomethylophilus sp.]|jgi:glutamine amidotransferase